MINLSPNQSEIVYAPIGQALQVLASAGSGKTRVLTERVRFILEHTKKEGVIALTFTNKAAEEMQNRLLTCEQAETRAWITTIHSLAQRILEQYGHTIGLPNDLQIYERDQDRMEVFMQSLREEGVDIDNYLNVQGSERRSRERNLQRYMDRFSLIKRELLTEGEVSMRFSASLWKVFQDYQRALMNSGGIDYEDILVYAHRILLTHEWIAKVYWAKYKHICVDEGQDLNKIQYEFIKSLSGETIRSVLIVGDPDQMIYGFNGSSADYLCTEFVRDFGSRAYILKENFRSTKSVIQAANKLKPNAQVENELTLMGQLNIHAFADESAEAESIFNTIRQLLYLKNHEEIEGEITLDKMVVIARNRFVFSTLESVLTEHNIVFSRRKGERQEAPSSLFGQVLDTAIRVKLNPKDWVNGQKLCNILSMTNPDVWGGAHLLTDCSQRIDRTSFSDPDLYIELLKAIDNLDTDTPNIRKFVRDFEQKLSTLADIASKSITDENSSRIEALKRSMDELNEFSACWTLLKRKGLGHSLSAFRNATALGKLTQKVTEAGIILSTVHTMKGLEKDIVFLIGMCEGVFPDYRAQTQTEINEERNNAFVAVTRAKRWLYITHPEKRKMPWGDTRPQQQSRFITEIQA